MSCCVSETLEFCIGDVLPGVADEFPNQEFSLKFIPTEQPLLIFHPGRAQLTAIGRLDMYLSDPRTRQNRHVATNAIDLQADAHLRMRGQRVVGNMTIHRMDLRLLRSSIAGLDENSIGDLSAFASQILEEQASANMQKGIPIPLVRGVRLRHPQLTILERNILVQTYFLLNEKRFNSLITRSVPTRPAGSRRRV